MSRGPDLERLLVLAIAAHSVAVGAGLILVPDWSLRFGGWPGADPLFFPVQAGVFHLVLAAGYVVEHLRYRGVTLLLVAKASAFVFLMAATAAGGVPWVVPFSGIADGLMGAAVALVHRRASRRS